MAVDTVQLYSGDGQGKAPSGLGTSILRRRHEGADTLGEGGSEYYSCQTTLQNLPATSQCLSDDAPTYENNRSQKPEAKPCCSRSIESYQDITAVRHRGAITDYVSCLSRSMRPQSSSRDAAAIQDNVTASRYMMVVKMTSGSWIIHDPSSDVGALLIGLIQPLTRTIVVCERGLWTTEETLDSEAAGGSWRKLGAEEMAEYNLVDYNLVDRGRACACVVCGQEA